MKKSWIEAGRLWLLRRRLWEHACPLWARTIFRIMWVVTHHCYITNDISCYTSLIKAITLISARRAPPAAAPKAPLTNRHWTPKTSRRRKRARTHIIARCERCAREFRENSRREDESMVLRDERLWLGRLLRRRRSQSTISIDILLIIRAHTSSSLIIYIQILNYLNFIVNKYINH